jgi:GNAT superfamily N-acetyltransferase
VQVAGLVSSDNGLRRQLNEADVIAGRKPEMRAYEPTLMDQLRYKAIDVLAPLFGGDERAANAYYRDKVQPTAEFLPGVGDVMAAAEAKDAFGQGDYLGGGLLAAGAAAGLVPGVGDVVQKGMRRFAKKVSPSEMGAGYGNVHTYTDPETGAYMRVVERLGDAPRKASTLDLYVPEEYRGQGIGKDLLAEVLAEHPSMMGQVSSKAAAKNAYSAGRRMLSNPNASLENIYKAIDENSSVLMATMDVSPPKSPVQRRGDEVLGLLKSGKADQVTDEMLDLGNAADNANLNAYLFENYDLPMDTPSRMKRAEDGGFDMMNDFYHGTVRDGYNETTDILAVDPSRSGDRWGADDMGFSITNSTQDANYYAKPGEFARKGELREGAIYPLMDKSTNPLDMRVGPMDGTISAWDERPADTYDVLKAGKHDAARLQSDGVEMRVVMDPANIRSRFARFDPRLKHLRNLSAGVGGGAVLANEIAKIIAGQKDDQTVY